MVSTRLKSDVTPRYRYNAFISYSREDDSKVACALQNALQSFARPWYRPRVLRVFRDDSGLSVNSDLWASLKNALTESEFYILLASPESAASPWVRQELQFWLETRPVESVLVGLTAGEVTEERGLGIEAWRDSELLPQVLTAALHGPPRYVDLRWARNSTELTLSNSRFSSCVADFAATLHRRPKDEIDGEAVRQHRRTVRVVQVVISTFVVLTIIASWAAVTATNRGTELKRQLQAVIAENMGKESLSRAQARARRKVVSAGHGRVSGRCRRPRTVSSRSASLRIFRMVAAMRV